MKCPHCGSEINIGQLLGSVKSERKTEAARRNGKLGGWPKGKKRKQGLTLVELATAGRL